MSDLPFRRHALDIVDSKKRILHQSLTSRPCTHFYNRSECCFSHYSYTDLPANSVFRSYRRQISTELAVNAIIGMGKTCSACLLEVQQDLGGMRQNPDFPPCLCCFALPSISLWLRCKRFG